MLRKRQIVRRTAVITVALTGAACCVLSAADRQAGTAGSIPRILQIVDFGPEHMLAQAVVALDSEDFELAGKFSTSALRRDPIGGNAPSLLATALLGSGRPALADLAYRVAAQMGWRDAGVQVYELLQTLGTEDVDFTAQRLDALLRSHGPSDFSEKALATIESSAGGRAALARRLSLSPDWALWYLQSLRGSPSLTLQRRSTTIVDAAKLGLKLPPRLVDATLRQLVSDGHYSVSQHLAIAFGLAPREPAGDIHDGSFLHPVDVSVPTALGWQFSQTGDVAISRATEAPGGMKTALFVQSSAASPRLVAKQTIALSPGPHVIRWRAVDREGRATLKLTIGVKCGASGLYLASPQRSGAPNSFVSFSVPSVACDEQEIDIIANPPSPGGTSNAWISSISVS